MSGTKREVTTRYGIADKAVGGLGGGTVKIRYFEESPDIDLEVSKTALILSRNEAVMLAKALLNAAMPNEEVFWGNDNGGAS